MTKASGMIRPPVNGSTRQVAGAAERASTPPNVDTVETKASPHPLDYEDKAKAPKGLFSKLFAAKGIWAYVDQGICSLGNFGTNFLLVRAWEAPEDKHLLGIYTLIFYSVLVFLNTLHGALVMYPMTLAGAAAKPWRVRQLALRGLGFTLFLSPVLGTLVVGACLRLERPELIPWALLAMLLWQGQETVRRILIAQLRHRSAIPGDVISFIGQVGFVLWMLHSGTKLTPELVLAGVAITSGAGGIIQLSQIFYGARHSRSDPNTPDTPSPRREAYNWWLMGRWLLLGCLVNVGTIYLTPWVLEAARGEAEVASLNALNMLLNLTNPIVFGTANLIVPAVAAAVAGAATKQEGFVAARRVTLRYGLFGFALVLPYYLLVLAFPGQILGLFGKSYRDLQFELPFVVAVYAMLFVAYMAVSLLNGLGRARDSFLATLVSSVMTVALVIPIASRYGLRGTLAAGPIPILAQTLVALGLAWRVNRRYAATSDPLPPIPIPRPASRRTRRLRVLVNAYAMSPARGSEPGVGWGYCRHLATHHDVTVLCAAGTPGEEHTIFKQEIEAWLKENGPVPGLTIHYVERPILSRLCQREDEIYRRTVYYVGYNAWQKAAYRAARHLHQLNPFDVIHQLNMTGFREPGYLWKLPAPFVWGPIAGAANVPTPFMKIMTFSDKVYYRFRNWSSEIQKRFTLRCRKAAERASHLWTIGQSSQDLVEKIWGFPSETLVESGASLRPDARVRKRDLGTPLKVVWSSLHIGRKGLPILLHALARLGPETPVEVTILGDGPLTLAWKELAEKLGVANRVKFAGRMPLSAALKVVSRADVMAFTSIQDGTPQAVLEAMSLGLPVICHDACGMGAVVTDACGIKVPLVDPETSFEGFAEALRRIHAEGGLLGRLSAGSIERTRELDWRHMAARVAAVYEQVAVLSPLPPTVSVNVAAPRQAQVA